MSTSSNPNYGVITLALCGIIIGAGQINNFFAERREEAKAAKKSEIEDNKLRESINFQKFEIQQAISDGRKLELLKVSIEATTRELIVTNASRHAIQSITIEISDNSAWEKILNERSNGTSFRDMPSKMRTDWLKSTNYDATRKRLYDETHYEVVNNAVLRPGEKFTRVIHLPKLSKESAKLTPKVTAVTDKSNQLWVSEKSGEFLDAMYPR